jgi:ribulose-phosphate 3-epimerase
MFMGRVGISILDCNLLRIEEELQELKRNNVEHIHLDVMDTTFVNNISFGPSIVNRILLLPDFVFDIHMMVDNPLGIISQLRLDNVSIVTIHQEVNGKREVFSYLKEKGVLCGLAINPCTYLDEVDMTDVDMILIMCVEAGFGGQMMKEECLRKIDESRKFNKIIGVDGGIKIENVSKVKNGDYIVIGSSYFKSNDRKKFLYDIRNELQK